MSNEFSTGKTIIVLGLVVGCFAILWPKIFFPMTQAAWSLTKSDPPNECKGLQACYVTTHSVPFLCGIFGSLKDEAQLLPQLSQDKGCRRALRDLCGIDLSAFSGNSSTLVEELRNCRQHYEEQKLGNQQKLASLLQHRQTPPHLQTQGGRRNDRSKVQFRDGRPFPHPSARQPTKHQPKTNGTMGVLMPVYTIAIICFFLYTILKLVTKKSSGEEEKPIVKDFKMDPEHRKFVLSEQYDEQGNPMETTLRKRKVAENGASVEKEFFQPAPLSEKDLEIHKLRQRLLETEAAMERIMKHMGAVSDCLAHTVAAPLEKSEEDEKPLRPQELHLKTPSKEAGSPEVQESKVTSPDPDSYEILDPSLPSSPLEVLEDPRTSSPDIDILIPSSDESPSIASLPDSSTHS